MDTQKQFNITCGDELDEGVFKLVCDAGEKRLAAIVNSLYKMESRSGTILGWLIGAIVALSGVIVVKSQEGWSVTLIMAIYAAAVIFAAFLVLVRTIHYKQSFHLPGLAPDNFLDDEIVKWLTGFKNDTARQRSESAACYILSINKGYYDNLDILKRWIKAYRAAIRTLIYGMAAGVVLLVSLIIYL